MGAPSRYIPASALGTYEYIPICRQGANHYIIEFIDCSRKIMPILKLTCSLYLKLIKGAHNHYV